MERDFKGKWITNGIFSNIKPRCVFHRQLEEARLDCTENRNQHILFRRRFCLSGSFERAILYVSADDYYKLYINGRFVGQGPAPAYHFQYNYNELDVTPYLQGGENVIALHTLYQGLINRVWQSGDLRHGMICDLVLDGNTVLSSDESFLVCSHTGFSEMGVCGYDTQFLEQYDSRAREVGFERPEFDDSCWEHASVACFDDHRLVAQKSRMLEFEEIAPVATRVSEDRVIYDFGSNYVGYLRLRATGKSGDKLIVRCAQELNGDGSPRYQLRANCKYEEAWIISDGVCELDQFDYKSFRYAEIILPRGAVIEAASLVARHYPFELMANMKSEYTGNPDLMRIWSLCVHTQRYGVQEVIQDCMEREKGFYLGDGCYTALTNMVLTHDDSMVRKLIDDAFSSSFITDTLVTCLDCSFMQEIAEYPLILVLLVLWHYRLTGDKEYLRTSYAKVVNLLQAYRREYEQDGLLKNLDKWCVVEWPKNFQHGYDVDILEGKVCTEAHVAINAYYLAAIRAANRMAQALGDGAYREEKEVADAFYRAFYDPERDLFRDGEHTDHISLVGNSFVYGFGLFNSEKTRRSILAMLDSCGIDSLSFFCTFPILMGLAKDGEQGRITDALLNRGAWLRMLDEDATTTFEGWGRDTKWNTSLFHLTMSYAALFLAEVDLKKIFE